jgi:hypothetical protein
MGDGTIQKNPDVQINSLISNVNAIKFCFFYAPEWHEDDEQANLQLLL